MMDDYRCRCGLLTYCHQRQFTPRGENTGWTRETIDRQKKRSENVRLCKEYTPQGFKARKRIWA